MNTKLSILFYIKRAKSNSDGKSPIYLRITVDGKRTEFSIKRFVEPEKWSTVQNKMKGNSEEARTINTYLDIFKSRIYEIQKDLIHFGKLVNGEVIKNILLGVNERKRTLIPIFKEHNDRMKALIGKEFAKGTYTRYKTCLSHTKEFLHWKYNVSDIEISIFVLEGVTGVYLHSINKIEYSNIDELISDVFIEFSSVEEMTAKLAEYFEKRL